jgi:hypothetical protein
VKGDNRRSGRCFSRAPPHLHQSVNLRPAVAAPRSPARAIHRPLFPSRSLIWGCQGQYFGFPRRVPAILRSRRSKSGGFLPGAIRIARRPPRKPRGGRFHWPVSAPAELEIARPGAPGATLHALAAVALVDELERVDRQRCHDFTRRRSHALELARASLSNVAKSPQDGARRLLEGRSGGSLELHLGGLRKTDGHWLFRLAITVMLRSGRRRSRSRPESQRRFH